VPPAAEAPRAHVGVGPALVASPGGFGASLAPALGAGYRITDVWSLELRFTGPTAADVSSSAGSAEITESLLVVGARAELLRLGALGGFVAGSAGGYHVGSDGSATPPNQSRADSALTSAWLAGAGLSLEAPVTRDFRVATVVRGDVGLLAPRPVVKLAGDAVARPGRPLVLGTLHFEARW
jgi:hypothetical protein